MRVQVEVQVNLANPAYNLPSCNSVVCLKRHVVTISEYVISLPVVVWSSLCIVHVNLGDFLIDRRANTRTTLRTNRRTTAGELHSAAVCRRFPKEHFPEERVGKRQAAQQHATRRIPGMSTDADNI